MSAQSEDWPRPHLLTKRLVRAVGDSAEVSAQLPVRLSLRSEPQPDFAVVRAKPGGYRSGHPAPGDVLVLIEVSDSTLRYDLGRRASVYASHAIAEYWVFDLPRNRVWRHRQPTGGVYARRDELASGALAIPGLTAEISIDNLF